MQQEIKVPDIGNFKDVEVIEVLVSAGDNVQPEASLITIESDKATMDVPAPFAGRVVKLLVKKGDRVSEGSPILVLDAEAAAVAAPPKPAPTAEASAAAPVPERTPAPNHAPPPSLPPMPRTEGGPLPYAGPAVRKFARELGVDLTRVSGSGPRGRIMQEDVKGFVKQALTAPRAAGGLVLAELPDVDFAQFGPIETRPLSRIKKLSATHLHRAWLNIPHVTQHEEADITELEAFRQELKGEAEKQGVRITILAFIMKAVVAALKKYPQFNASLTRDGEGMVFKQYYHLGVAVDTPNGLVVPVIRDVDRKGVFDLARELGEVSERMRAGKIAPNDVQGGTFTISSLGGIGGTGFTPVVNAPEVAILGVSRSAMRPVYRDGQFVPRLMLPLSLSYDHRAIDGAEAARFAADLARFITDIRLPLL